MSGIVLQVIQRTKKKLRQGLEANMKVCNCYTTTATYLQLIACMLCGLDAV